MAGLGGGEGVSGVGDRRDAWREPYVARVSSSMHSAKVREIEREGARASLGGFQWVQGRGVGPLE